MADAKGGSQELMSAAEAKPLLAQSKRKPVSCAVGMTKDKEGVLLLDRRMKPRKLMAEMKSKAKGAGIELDPVSARFGRASVDPADGATVTFTINKAAPAALRMKLVEKLRGAGFRKCELIVDETLEDESDEEDESGANDAGEASGAAAGGDGAVPGGGPQADAGVAAGSGAGQVARRENAPAVAEATGAGSNPAAARSPAEGAGQDAAPATASLPSDAPGAAAIREQLTALVKRLLAVQADNPPGLDAMRSAAKAGQTALQSGDLAFAAQAAEALGHMLNGPGSATGAGAAGASASARQASDAGWAADGAQGGAAPPADAQPGPAASRSANGFVPGAATASSGPAGQARHKPGSPVFAKGRQAWTAVRAKVQDDLDAVVQESAGHYGRDSEQVKAIRDCFEPVMEQLDDSLAAKLDEMSKAADSGAHERLVREAQAILRQYEGFIDGSPVVALVDRNPFRPVAIRKTLDAALAALSQVVRTEEAADART